MPYPLPPSPLPLVMLLLLVLLLGLPLRVLLLRKARKSYALEIHSKGRLRRSQCRCLRANNEGTLTLVIAGYRWTGRSL